MRIQVLSITVSLGIPIRIDARLCKKFASLTGGCCSGDTMVGSVGPEKQAEAVLKGVS